MRRRPLDPLEARILAVLIQNEGFLNTAEVAREARVSWNTALAYLKKFYRDGWVEKKGRKTVYWRAIYEEY